MKIKVHFHSYLPLYLIMGLGLILALSMGYIATSSKEDSRYSIDSRNNLDYSNLDVIGENSKPDLVFYNSNKSLVIGKVDSWESWKKKNLGVFKNDINREQISLNNENPYEFWRTQHGMLSTMKETYSRFDM